MREGCLFAAVLARPFSSSTLCVAGCRRCERLRLSAASQGPREREGPAALGVAAPLYAAGLPPLPQTLPLR